MTPRVDVVRGDCAMLGVGGTLWLGVHQAKYRGNFGVMMYPGLVSAERFVGHR